MDEIFNLKAKKFCEFSTSHKGLLHFIFFLFGSFRVYVLHMCQVAIEIFFLPISIVVLCVSNEIQSRIEKYANCGEVFVYGTTSCLFMGQLQLL